MNGKPWSKKELKLLEKIYPDTPTKDVAKKLNRKINSVYNQVFQMQLKKSDAFLNTPASGRLLKGMRRGKDNEFRKGQPAWNKGMKGLDIGGKETRFKPGSVPVNYRAVGSERTDTDGYVMVKIADPRTWKMKHVVEWEKVNGKVPKGFIVVMKNKIRTDTRPENLELISRAENMKRNTIHNYPKEIALVVQLRGALNRQINKHLNEK